MGQAPVQVPGRVAQWHSASQIAPSLHTLPGGSHCSPRAGVTTPSPQRAAQSLPRAAQHVWHSRTESPHAVRSARAVPLACRRHRRRSEWLPTHSARSACRWFFTCAIQAPFACLQLRRHSFRAGSAASVTCAEAGIAMVTARMRGTMAAGRGFTGVGLMSPSLRIVGRLPLQVGRLDRKGDSSAISALRRARIAQAGTARQGPKRPCCRRAPGSRPSGRRTAAPPRRSARPPSRRPSWKLDANAASRRSRP